MSTISCNYLSRIGLHVSSDAVGRERPEKVHGDEHVGEEERDVAARLRNLFLSRWGSIDDNIWCIGIMAESLKVRYLERGTGCK